MKKKKISRKKKLIGFELAKKRIKIINTAISILFLVIIFRLFILHVFPISSNSLQHLANHQYQKEVKLSPYRGNIYDHRKTPLAIGSKAPSVAINPRIFSPTKLEINKLSKILEIPPNLIAKSKNRRNYFAWLKRKATHYEVKQLKKLKIKGINIIYEPSRSYPGETIAAPLLGYVGIDNKGLLGVELMFDSLLSAQSQQILRQKDARGSSIFLSNNSAAPEKSGHNVILTIDKVIQEIAEESIKRWVKKSGAKKAFAIVADPHTGKILAVANFPSFNPNNRKTLKENNMKNTAFIWPFEPGSIIKPIVVAAAIEENLTSLFEVHNCEKDGRYRVDKKNFIHDDHPKEFQTTEEIIKNSSNICTVKIAQKLGPQKLFRSLRSFGFGKKSIVGFPGETSGRIQSWELWKPIRFANIAFGQGMLANGLELIQAYSTFANGGNLVKPHLVESIESSGEEVVFRSTPEVLPNLIKASTAREIRKALSQVVTSGTGKLAQTVSFTAAGKTGTSEKYDRKVRGYSSKKRIASFIGFSPVSDPHLVAIVVIDEPSQKPYYGGKWAAPAFSEIIEKSLRYLNVAPDKLLAKRPK